MFYLLAPTTVNKLLENHNVECKLFQACGVLCAIEPLNSFLASLCKFTINNPNEAEKKRYAIPPVSVCLNTTGHIAG